LLTDLDDSNTNMPETYFKVHNFSSGPEVALLEGGKNVRNYGRLSQKAINGLVAKELSSGDPRKLLNRNRPWRFKRFLRDLIDTKEASYGVASHRGYTIRVLNGDIQRYEYFKIKLSGLPPGLYGLHWLSGGVEVRSVSERRPSKYSLANT